MRPFLPALLIIASITAGLVHADTTVPPSTNAAPELAAIVEYLKSLATPSGEPWNRGPVYDPAAARR